MRYLLLILVVLFLVIGALVYRVLSRPQTPAAAANVATSAKTGMNGDVLADPTAPPEMADAPGKNEVLTACGNCHSLRYITMQPPFSRKVWTAEVAKMVNVYKAGVDPAQQEAIVNYLAAAYGTPEAK